MMDGLRKLFAGTVAGPVGPPSPLGPRIGQPFFVDPLAVELLGEARKLRLDDPTLIVAARGVASLDEAAALYRYYTEGNAMITALTRGGSLEQHIEEVTLYVPLSSHYPEAADAALWASWERRLGAPELTLDDGTVYRRVWFAEAPGPAEPVAFTEEIWDEETAEAQRWVNQKVMLFHRELDSGKSEFLTVGIEETPSGRSVELMVGMDLDRASLSVA